jgi:trehalose 6-phosphate synthase
MLRRAPLDSETIWTAARLQSWLGLKYADQSIVVLSNREPFRHDYAPEGTVVVRRSAGGLVTALEPLVQASGGTWVAHGAGTADRVVVDHRDGLQVPAANPSYRLRRVWLDAHEEQGYYQGFANEGLWPLCHRVYVQPTFRSDDFNCYKSVNRRFTQAVCEEVDSDSPLVLAQDYHMALAPQMIRGRLPGSSIVTFWHIPFPHPREFTVCPWAGELLDGLLGSTIVGFQTPDDCANFLDTVEDQLDGLIDRARSVIEYRGREVAVRAYPVSVEWPSRLTLQSPPVDRCQAEVRRGLGVSPDALLIVGVDRLDYTKGINEKLLAVERLLEIHPEFCGRLVFVQIAEPSRECLSAYRELGQRLTMNAERINSRFGSGRYRPIIMLDTRHEPADVYRFFRAADVCYVGSLHDGMNLVAKEFVSARDDNRGVLVLSTFAGAARELRAAVIVNPHAIDECAQSLAAALSMPAEEQARQMRSLRAVVARNNGYRWAGEMLTDTARIRDRTRASRASARERSPSNALSV